MGRQVMQGLPEKFFELGLLRYILKLSKAGIAFFFLHEKSTLLR